MPVWELDRLEDVIVQVLNPGQAQVRKNESQKPLDPMILTSAHCQLRPSLMSPLQDGIHVCTHRGGCCRPPKKSKRDNGFLGASLEDYPDVEFIQLHELITYGGQDITSATGEANYPLITLLMTLTL